jgi:PhoPQ-activated pathogenicity-related protein
LRTARTRHAWLSITPEPERELPAAVAELRAGGSPGQAAVEAERRRVERLVTGGSRRAWTAYIAAAAELAQAADREGELADARALVIGVIDNHDKLTLGLPGGFA